MFFVYVLRSQKDGRFYVGLTNDVTRRFAQHNKGQNKSTKAYVPWDLFFTEEYITRPEARQEKYI